MVKGVVASPNGEGEEERKWSGEGAEQSGEGSADADFMSTSGFRIEDINANADAAERVAGT